MGRRDADGVQKLRHIFTEDAFGRSFLQKLPLLRWECRNGRSQDLLLALSLRKELVLCLIDEKLADGVTQKTLQELRLSQDGVQQLSLHLRMGFDSICLHRESGFLTLPLSILPEPLSDAFWVNVADRHRDLPGNSKTLF
jgi:hypothetical protein